MAPTHASDTCGPDGHVLKPELDDYMPYLREPTGYGLVSRRSPACPASAVGGGNTSPSAAPVGGSAEEALAEAQNS